MDDIQYITQRNSGGTVSSLKSYARVFTIFSIDKGFYWDILLWKYKDILLLRYWEGIEIFYFESTFTL